MLLTLVPHVWMGKVLLPICLGALLSYCSSIHREGLKLYQRLLQELVKLCLNNSICSQSWMFTCRNCLVRQPFLTWSHDPYHVCQDKGFDVRTWNCSTTSLKCSIHDVTKFSKQDKFLLIASLPWLRNNSITGVLWPTRTILRLYMCICTLLLWRAAFLCWAPFGSSKHSRLCWVFFSAMPSIFPPCWALFSSSKRFSSMLIFFFFFFFSFFFFFLLCCVFFGSARHRRKMLGRAEKGSA